MRRKIDLVSFLPPFMQEFREIKETLEAENPEFEILWDATERVFKNTSFLTADEVGISRYEKIMGILPSKNESLESRRARVSTRWFNDLPSTLKAFILKIQALSENENFTVSKFYDYYRLEISTQMSMFGQTAELERLIEQMLPCNIIVVVKNNIPVDITSKAAVGGVNVFTETFIIKEKGVV